MQALKDNSGSDLLTKEEEPAQWLQTSRSPRQNTDPVLPQNPTHSRSVGSSRPLITVAVKFFFVTNMIK
jgi:hypothetical protein